MIGIAKQFIIKTFANPVQSIWLSVLMLANMAIPFFFLDRFEARLVLICIILAFFTGLILFKMQGFTYLLGLMHFSWIPLLIFLSGRLVIMPAIDFFGVWIRTIIVLDGISLAYDITDVRKYVYGNRGELR